MLDTSEGASERFYHLAFERLPDLKIIEIIYQYLLIIVARDDHFMGGGSALACANPSLTQGRPVLLDVVFRFLKTFESINQHFRFRDQSPAFLRFRSVVAKHHRVLVDELRGLPVPWTHNATRQSVIDRWSSFCRKVEYTTGSADPIENRDLSEDEDEAACWETREHCYNRKCICSDPDAEQFHPFRACKGCRRVLYCSERCQTK